MMEAGLIILGTLILLTLGLILIKLPKKIGNKETEDIDLLNRRIEVLNTSNSVAQEKERIISDNLVSLQSRIQEKDDKILELSGQISKKEAEYNGLLEKLKEQKADIEKLQEKFRIEFKNLANEILEEKTQKFTEQTLTKLHPTLI